MRQGPSHGPDSPGPCPLCTQGPVGEVDFECEVAVMHTRRVLKWKSQSAWRTREYTDGEAAEVSRDQRGPPTQPKVGRAVVREGSSGAEMSSSSLSESYSFTHVFQFSKTYFFQVFMLQDQFYLELNLNSCPSFSFGILVWRFEFE